MRHVYKWRRDKYDHFDAHSVVPGDTLVCVAGNLKVIYVAVANDSRINPCDTCDLGYPGCMHYAFRCEGIHLKKPSNAMEEL